MAMMVMMMVVDVMMAYLNARASARQSWRLMTAQSQASMVANTIPKNLDMPWSVFKFNTQSTNFQLGHFVRLKTLSNTDLASPAKNILRLQTQKGGTACLWWAVILRRGATTRGRGGGGHCSFSIFTISLTLWYLFLTYLSLNLGAISIDKFGLSPQLCIMRQTQTWTTHSFLITTVTGWLLITKPENYKRWVYNCLFN